jgi:hypothetical protein
MLLCQIQAPEPLSSVKLGVTLHNTSGDRICGMSSDVQGILGEGTARVWDVSCSLERISLNAGKYGMSCYFGKDSVTLATFPHVAELHISEGDPFGWGKSLPRNWGYFYGAPDWKLTPTQLKS